MLANMSVSKQLVVFGQMLMQYREQKIVSALQFLNRVDKGTS